MEVYLLFQGSSYVDLDGSTDCDSVTAIFSSLDKLNAHVEANYFDMVIDLRNREKFSNEVTRIEEGDRHMYYEIWSVL